MLVELLSKDEVIRLAVKKWGEDELARKQEARIHHRKSVQRDDYQEQPFHARQDAPSRRKDRSEERHRQAMSRRQHKSPPVATGSL